MEEKIECKFSTECRVINTPFCPMCKNNKNAKKTYYSSIDRDMFGTQSFRKSSESESLL